MAAQPVLCLAGATATGKTSIAISIADALGAEIINADSRQVYADFPGICAQPTEAEKKRAPHHLYGMLATSEAINAGEWCRMAYATVCQVLARGHVPLLVGGTGMYFHSLLHGILPIPPIDPAIRSSLESRIEAFGPLALYDELKAFDLAYAETIHPHDRQRIVRAHEVYEQTGHTISWWRKQASLQRPFCYGPLYVLLADRLWLAPRIETRIERMLEEGALDEARAAYAHCSDPDAPGWTGIGCAELMAYLLGRIRLDEAQALWVKHTKAYAKRQNTWFRGRSEAQFFDPAKPQAVVEAAIREWRRLIDEREDCYAGKAAE
ncbi:MAG: tRNA (adenosine(37)-N6)-dimethylallyltransferase MiaA [Desulfovibrionaceae bacterium]|nr:tRNA (adenosine(37)-N6)-dimethylallyltransferase MiaA [Desulfovibrionaceae bacterium]